MIIQTERLVLRPWRDEDLVPFAELNADPRVMEHFPAILSREESDALADRLSRKLREQGWGLWAVSVPGVADFIGFIGLNATSFKAHFTPAVEVGWRLAYKFWGQGYATEGAKAVLQYAFDSLHLKEVVSFTAETNIRSIAVMERIGMEHDVVDDFDHPPRRHALYRITRENFEMGHRAATIKGCQF